MFADAHDQFSSSSYSLSRIHARALTCRRNDEDCGACMATPLHRLVWMARAARSTRRRVLKEIHDMSDYRWHDDDYRRGERRGWTDRTADEVRSWFGDDDARIRRGNDERQDRYPYGGERSWRDRDERGRYERSSGSSGWRGARDVGGYEGSRESWSGSDRDYGPGDYDRGDYGRGYGDSGRGAAEHWRERQQYGRGQYGSTSYDRGQIRRGDDHWTSAGGVGARDWERREDMRGWGHRTSPWGETEYSPSGPWERSRESYAGRGPKGYRRSDERIREEVSDALTADPQVDASEISVQVVSGEVTLSGSVATREQKRRAEDCAEHVAGVSDVTNNLRVNKQDDRHDVSRLVTPSVVGSEPQTR
jgi:hypothetical protein